jgi:hypothetical protein
MRSVVTPYALLSLTGSINAGYRLNCNAPSLTNAKRPNHACESIEGLLEQSMIVSVDFKTFSEQESGKSWCRCHFGVAGNLIS